MTLNFAPSTDEQLTEALSGLLDEALVVARGSEPIRDYLGGSRLGEACERRLFYEYSNAAVDPGRGFSGKTLRIFDMGHDAEERMAAYLRLAGFQLITHRPDGSQLGFAVAADPAVHGRYRVRGHIDGVIVDGPDLSRFGVRYPCLWENKALGSKSFAKMRTGGLKVANPVYYAQVQTYMAYLDLDANPTLWTAIDRDTGDVLPQLVPFDRKAAQEATDRGVRVISAQEAAELPRIASERTFWVCKFCDFQDRCWEPGPVAQAAAAPGWLRAGPTTHACPECKASWPDGLPACPNCGNEVPF